MCYDWEFVNLLVQCHIVIIFFQNFRLYSYHSNCWIVLLYKAAVSNMCAVPIAAIVNLDDGAIPY